MLEVGSDPRMEFKSMLGGLTHLLQIKGGNIPWRT